MTNAHVSRDYWAIVGTYTHGGSKGIYVFRLETESGKLEPVGDVAAVNPAFLAVHPSGRFVYAVGETGEFNGHRGGSVSAYAFDRASGSLSPLNTVSSLGGSPCHLTVDAAGRFLLVVNYTGGNVSVLPIHADGSLGEAIFCRDHAGSSVHPDRQTGPHPHSIHLDAENRFVFVPDLGIDRVAVYAFDSGTGALSPLRSEWAELHPGAGPRHMAFHPSRRHAYVINELDSTVTAFAYDPERGRLEPIQAVSTLPEDFKGESTCAEVVVHPNGRLLFGSNRGHDSIAVFHIDVDSGRLAPAAHVPTQGRTPRNFALDPHGNLLFAENQDSDTIVSFAIDSESGALRPTGHVTHVPTPVCMKFIPC